ncbi:hypothetical protein, partial [Escherichia coli]|uniref:hypothetical protein n=1 Tax=Escherichia coli TaxID=562 RepID=UPI0015D9DF8D
CRAQAPGQQEKRLIGQLGPRHLNAVPQLAHPDEAANEQCLHLTGNQETHRARVRWQPRPKGLSLSCGRRQFTQNETLHFEGCCRLPKRRS